MRYACASCHNIMTVEGDEAPHRCSQCGKEAGLEPEHSVTDAMKLFGAVVITVLVSSVGASAFALLAG